MKSLVRVNKLTKVFPPEKKGGKPFRAVNKVSFDIKQGEVLGLLGPNGAGKSTTISMMLGVLTPSSGKVQYFGKSLSDNRSQIMQEVTFASTYIRMPWRLSVMENLRVYGVLYGLSNAQFQNRAEKFLKFFEVWQQRNKTMNRLSAGQVTRVMLAKAFIPHPKVVLLDEPTASLDPDIAHQVRTFIKQQQNEFNTTMLYTSHNMDEVAEICDRVAFLRKGTIVAVDKPEKLAASTDICTMRLWVKDGLKRTVRFSKELGYQVHATDREVAIKLNEGKIAEFLTKLAETGIEYTQISIDKPDLEDYFLSMSEINK